MFYEWVSAGAIFGIEAFFALFMFALLCAMVLGIVLVVGRVFEFGGKREEDHRD